MVILDVLAWLWDVAAGPVLHELGIDGPPRGDITRWPRVWWAPGGLLTLLPIHAAGHHAADSDPQHRAVLDRVVSSYTPTVTALRHARQHPTARTPPTGAERALIVAMPTTPGLLYRGRLPQVIREARLVADHLPGAVALTEPPGRAASPPAETTPTKTRVLTHLTTCAIAHFACHGLSDPADPSASRLLLHDHQHDPLTVASLAPITLSHARLAYLSACSTALTSHTDLLDESIHLTSAFQMAGFPTSSAPCGRSRTDPPYRSPTPSIPHWPRGTGRWTPAAPPTLCTRPFSPSAARTRSRHRNGPRTSTRAHDPHRWLRSYQPRRLTPATSLRLRVTGREHGTSLQVHINVVICPDR
ncbi:CHAT domain-containing protein [Acrocarpospora sp. B8E8]|uniref:CHAT domain-containing protein n=1 Tax=Acrocarpospora sp. B8E8 TaxID=3153572 RepID=UPI00325C7D14